MCVCVKEGHSHRHARAQGTAVQKKKARRRVWNKQQSGKDKEKRVAPARGLACGHKAEGDDEAVVEVDGEAQGQEGVGLEAVRGHAVHPGLPHHQQPLGAHGLHLHLQPNQAHTHTHMQLGGRALRCVWVGGRRIGGKRAVGLRCVRHGCGWVYVYVGV